MESTALTITSIPVPVRVPLRSTFTLLTTVPGDGESMIGLCYHTFSEAVPLWVSVDAADTLDRRSCYLKYGTINCPADNIQEAGRALREHGKHLLQRDSNHEVTGQLF